MASAFPFLGLPREIRDLIYRQLLLTYYTFTAPYTTKSYGWPYKFTPAILRLNKQVSCEAAQVMYTENQFVVLRIATRRYPCLKGFPKFAGLSEDQVQHPTMEITIQDLDMVPLDQRTVQTFIFTLEGFPYFIKRLLMVGKMCNFYSTMSCALSVYNQAPSRQEYLDKQIVKSLDQIQGFAEFRIGGDVDDEIARYLTEGMAQGSHLHDVLYRITGLFSQSELYFKQKKYQPAKWYLGLLSVYWDFLDQSHLRFSRLTPPRTQYLHREFLEATIPIIMKMRLRILMINLNIKDYRLAADIANSPLVFAEKLINKYSLSYTVSHLLQAKFLFCRYIGQFMLRQREKSAETLTLTALTLQRDRRFATKSSSELCNELEWARDGFLGQQKDPRSCHGKGSFNSFLDMHAALLGLRSFQDWMELPEEDLGS